MGINLTKLKEMVEDRGATGWLQSMRLQRVRHDLATEQQQLRAMHYANAS